MPENAIKPSKNGHILAFLDRSKFMIKVLFVCHGNSSPSVMAKNNYKQKTNSPNRFLRFGAVLISKTKTNTKPKPNFYLLNPALFLIVGSKIFFLILSDSGVTSNNSSVSIKSRACSKLKILGGDKRKASSALDERVLVSCFFLHTLSSMSSPRPFWPTTIPE